MEKYTQIQNIILEKLAMSELTAAEFRVLLVFIRKINGFHKKTDAISISQIAKFSSLSIRHIKRCLKHLQEINLLSQIQKGSSSRNSSIWQLNTDIDSWQLVTRTSPVENEQLVTRPSLELVTRTTPELVTRPSPTKESIKENIKRKKENNKRKVEVKKFKLEDFLEDFNMIRKYFLPNSRGITIVDKKTIQNFKFLVKAGVTREQMQQALKTLFLDKHHQKTNWKYATPEFITRSDKFARFAMTDETQIPEQGALALV